MKVELYRNNLKNRNFDKEDPQNWHSERGTIAEWQGPSENANSEDPPYQNSDSSSCFGINPYLSFPFCLREEGEDCDMLAHFYESSGLTVSEDRLYIYVEASLPGIQSDEIEMVFEYGTLWITAKRKNAIRFKRRFYSQALSHFSYRVAIPVDVEEKPKRVRCKNGILKLVFVKKKKIFSKALGL